MKKHQTSKPLNFKKYASVSVNVEMMVFQLSVG
jgi:hypothetical protein